MKNNTDMSLKSAHEGYEYQDLLTSFFILKEILNENNSTFKIDTKEYPEDKIDDLTITNSFGVFKKQIKYSNEKTNQRLKKEFISRKSTYKLALDTIFHSWNIHPNKNNCEVRICLAWQEPIDELMDVLRQHLTTHSFSSDITKIYQIDIDKLWPNGKNPLNNWQRFKKESANINRSDFGIFCSHLIIETKFPKQSPNTSFSGELETIVIEQIKKLGIGEFPNNRTTPKAFALELIQLVRRSRSRGLEIKTEDIFKKLNIQTDFGSIEQVFPVDEQKNIKTEDAISTIKTVLGNESRIILIGEPGSGKSWFIQNLQNKLQNNYKIVRHYCYTELKDTHSKERITLNIFYGNLINDILSIFPDLKDKKEQRYASNLNELNNILQNINEETILIIDGLDHIDRIHEFHRLNFNDIKIIDAISQLQTSSKVKILIVSQPIEKLGIFSAYKKIEIPKWNKSEILAYFSKNNISDIQIAENKSLSDFLFEKSNGNPLYLSYLIEEIKSSTTITTEVLNSLPPYSYNLQEYYQYLLKKSDFYPIVPQILSGANFSLSKNEIKEITRQGKNVDKTITILAPILKENHSTGGFIIYHESFRRFIIERLMEDEVDIEYSIFRPLIEWFEGKDFYNFPKAYKFYFQLLYTSEKYNKILDFLNNDFVTKSIYHGHSFDAVKSNYDFLAKSALKQKDFPKIIQANEINKVLSSTEDAYCEGFSLYLSALGYLKGFKTIADYLVFEGKPTLPLSLGIEACYLCNQNKEPAPWELYSEYVDNKHEISVSDFKYYIRGLLVFKNTKLLIKVAENIINQYPQYVKSFANELLEYHEYEYINKLKNESQVFDKLINYLPEININTNTDLISLAQQVLNIEHMFEDELKLLESFFIQVEKDINDTALINQIIQLFIGKNWFHNWLIYGVKIKSLQSNILFFDINEAFQYLICDTELFKGEPRTCDLYRAENFIYESIVEGLKFIKTRNEWDEIIEILIKLSNDTTTELRKSLNGPLVTNKLFQLLDENANKINREKVIHTFEQSISKNQDYNLHSYIAEYYFRLSKQYSIIENKEKAELNYKTGIKFLLGYTERRDITVEDLVDTIESYTEFNHSTGSKYIKKIKPLIDAVTNHTDGKDTEWFPIEWFEKYLTINFEEAALYLLSQIENKSYNWIFEEQLQALLIKAEVNPIIELFIYCTFTSKTSTNFLLYGQKLVEKIESSEAIQLLSDLFNGDFNDNTTLLAKFGFDNSKIKNLLPKSTEYFKELNTIDFIKNNSISRKEFSNMTTQELIEYFSKYELKETDLISLYYYFYNQKELTPEIQDIIKTIVEKAEDYPKTIHLDLSAIFEHDIPTYYWICRFVSERDGWYRNLYNTEAFEKAYLINSELAINSTIEMSEKLLKIGSNRSFSGNLLKALIKVGYQSNIIEDMWNVLYKATEFRLPVTEEVDWNELLSNDLDMNIEEILICFLFSRFSYLKSHEITDIKKSHEITLSNLVYLYQLYPEKMIKPTKWFLLNYKHFLKGDMVIILEILYDINEYELNDLYPYIALS